MEYYLDFFEPKNYNLKLSINKHTKKIYGTEIITGVVKAKNIKFHAVCTKIKSLSANGKNIDFELTNEDLILKNIEQGQINIVIEFENDVSTNMEGAYLSTYNFEGHEEEIIVTQFESHYARKVFPCIDEPAAKATFDISIEIPDEDDMVLSNMPLKEQTGTTFIFETSPRMSTYLLAFAIGKFHGKTITNSHGVTITTYAPLNQPLDSVDFANEIAAKSLEFYDDEFGIAYPLKKLDQLAIPDFEAGAMENWGLVTYRESMLLADSATTIDTKKMIAETVAHELSHQWFGDLVTMKWWDDLWLNESFASIMEYYAVDHIHKEYNIWEEFFTYDCLAALNRDAYDGVQSVHQDVESPAEIATLFDGAIVYAKGARLMLMLIRMMGWENFTNGLKDYFAKNKYDNTVGDDLWEALKPYADFDVKEFMHEWINKPGYPVITDGKQQKFRLDGQLVESSWMLPHVSDDMSGHYIMNLSEKEFEEKLANFDSLTLEQKLRLLIDRNLIAKTNLASSASLLELIQKFKNENSASVWEIIVIIIGSLKVFFVPDSIEEKAFKNFVKELISEKLAEIMEQKELNDNDLRLRSFLLGLDYYAEDVPNLQKIAALFCDDLEKINPELRDDIISARLYLEPKILDRFIEKYKVVANPGIKASLLYTMTLTKDESNIEKLAKLLSEPKIVKPQDNLRLYIGLFRNPKAKDLAFGWLKTNWDYLKEVAGDKSLEDYPRLMGNVIKTEEDKKAFWEFFDDKRNDEAIARSLKVAEKEINARLELIKNDRNAVYEFLK